MWSRRFASAVLRLRQKRDIPRRKRFQKPCPILRESWELSFSSEREGASRRPPLLGSSRKGRDIFCLSKRWPLGLDGMVSLAEIESRPIACPLDIRFVRPYIESQFQARGLTPRFQFVEPTLNGFLSFLRNGGVVFIRKGGSIPKDVAGICEIDLRDGDSFAIPFFLVCKAGCPPEMVELIIAFFRERLG